jgi:hypothetical protein
MGETRSLSGAFPTIIEMPRLGALLGLAACFGKKGGSLRLNCQDGRESRPATGPLAVSLRL